MFKKKKKIILLKDKPYNFFYGIVVKEKRIQYRVGKEVKIKFNRFLPLFNGITFKEQVVIAKMVARDGDKIYVDIPLVKITNEKKKRGK